MADVTSGKNMTVIVLNNDEASALADLLAGYVDGKHFEYDHTQILAKTLDELTNAMLSNKNLVGSCEEGEEGWIGPGPVPTDWCGT
jgi:hypothetical protein